jgi:hypothetical protein
VIAQKVKAPVYTPDPGLVRMFFQTEPIEELVNPPHRPA